LINSDFKAEMVAPLWERLK